MATRYLISVYGSNMHVTIDTLVTDVTAENALAIIPGCVIQFAEKPGWVDKQCGICKREFVDESEIRSQVTGHAFYDKTLMRIEKVLGWYMTVCDKEECRHQGRRIVHIPWINEQARIEKCHEFNTHGDKTSLDSAEEFLDDVPLALEFLHQLRLELDFIPREKIYAEWIKGNTIFALGVFFKLSGSPLVNMLSVLFINGALGVVICRDVVDKKQDERMTRHGKFKSATDAAAFIKHAFELD